MVELDATDERLLAQLVEDGRRTFSDLARDVGLSVGAVKRRVDRLGEDGVIRGFGAKIDHSQLGWTVEAFTEVRYAGRTHMSDMVALARAQPEVQAVYTIAGDPDALIRVRARDLAHLQDVIDRLRRAGPITGTKTLMVLNRWSRDGS